jgi:hypothetical protein
LPPSDAPEQIEHNFYQRQIRPADYVWKAGCIRFYTAARRQLDASSKKMRGCRHGDKIGCNRGTKLKRRVHVDYIFDLSGKGCPLPGCFEEPV